MERNSNNYYEALAGTVNLEDVTSCERNQRILRRLRDNEWDEEYLHITGAGERQFEEEYRIEYRDSDDQWGWLAHFAAKNGVGGIVLTDIGPHDINGKERLGSFQHWRTVEKMEFHDCDLSSEIFQMLDPLVKNSHHLRDMIIVECQLGNGRGRLLSLFLAGCTRSLEKIISVAPKSRVTNPRWTSLWRSACTLDYASSCWSV